MVEKVCEKNNLIVDRNKDIEEKNLPFGIQICGHNNEIYRLNQKVKTADLIPIKDLILVNDKIIFCDSEDGIVGPYDCRFNFEIGDKIRLIKADCLYTSYNNWFAENNIDLDIASRYGYMNSGYNFKGKTGKIIACGPHSKEDPTNIYCIEFEAWFYKPTFLVNEKGIVLEDIE